MSDTDLERRLRAALSARAAVVTRQDLRPRPAPSRPAHRGIVARWWLPLTAGLAAAAVSITAFALLRPADPAPPAAPAPSARPAQPTPSPSPSAPAPATRPPSGSPSGSLTGSPSGSTTPSRSAAAAGSTPTASAPQSTLAPTPQSGS